MSAKRPQTFAKRARELAVKERRDEKRARKAAAAAERAESNTIPGAETAPATTETPDTAGSRPTVDRLSSPSE